jgi:acyl dehydratase
MISTMKIEDFPKLVGRELEPSEWIEITQDRVNQFADATNDHQFIHVDIGRRDIIIDDRSLRLPLHNR